MKHSVVLFRSAVKAFLFMGFMALALGASAQVKLSVQGLLKKGDGTSQPDGNVTMKFNFYKASDNSFVASVTATDVPVSGGVYSALLDVSSSSPSNALTFATEYVVGLQVNGGTEMTPRISLTAAPYALALNGVSNVFPTLGTVKVDAIDVAGAVNATGAVNANSTLSVAGNATLSGTTNTKTVIADGRIFSNDGFSYQSGGAGFSTGLFFDGSSKRASIYTEGNVRFHAWDDNKNYYRASAGHIFDIGDVNVSGTARAGSFQRNGSNQGMFFDGGGGTDLSLRLASGGDRILIGNNNVTYYNAPSAHVFSVGGLPVMELTYPYNQNLNNENDWALTSIKVYGLQRGPDRRNVQFDPTNQRLFFDTSSRRYKRNIKDLKDDFSLILKAQPKTYTRPNDETNTWEIGYIAEEMDSLGLQRLVEYNADGTIDGFNYEKMILYVTEVVKTQHADIEKLKAEVAALTAEKNALRTENTSLRADVQNQQADFGKQLHELSRRLKSLETAASNR